ncbi:MAG: hypothetical protein AB7G40_05440 [Hyphomonadaceae bacterium]
MGEASRRKRANREWFSSLAGDERIVAETALKLYHAFPDDGACYRKAFFLRHYLRERHGIEAAAVVGFVNDGTDELYGSHAWLDYQGKKVDLALSMPLRPELQKRGPMLLLDWIYTPGWTGYTYHLDRPATALAEILELMRHPDTHELIQEAETLHLTMSATARSDSLIEAYLANAPDGIDFAKTAALVERTIID